MKKAITVKTMNTKSIDRAIKEIKGRKRLTQRRILEIQERLSQRGVEIAQAYCRAFTHSTGQLERSIKAKTEYKNGKFRTYIIMDTPYAAFVEFGTGIVGAADPHPNANRRGWDYDVNGHGEEGWFYPYDDSRRHKYRFNFETGKMQPWTDGEPAKPIMYYTLQDLKKEYPNIVREVFSH